MSTAGKTTVYYNSACPVCRTGIGMQQGAIDTCEIEWIDVHKRPEAVRELGINIEAVRERLHVRDAEGVKVGADAAAALWSRTRGLRWASRLLGFPRLRARTIRLRVVRAVAVSMESSPWSLVMPCRGASRRCSCTCWR